jgi:hypothetical protein
MKHQLNAEMVEHINTTLRITAGTLGLTDQQLGFLAGVVFGLMHEQELRLQRRVRHALRDYQTTGASAALYNVMQFASTFGRWEAAQTIRRLRKELREARAGRK